MDERWSIGELASATGLTARALRHYDELGLVVPSGRTPAGHRRYSPADVRRLYQVVALRRLGFGLADVAAVLSDPSFDLRAAVRRHLERVERRIAAEHELRERLGRVLDALDRGAEPSSGDLLAAVERTTMIEKYYTAEQLEELERRREALGPEGMEQAQRDWAELIAAVDAERRAGTDPADPKVQELARRWKTLIEAFTGGDPAMHESLQRMYDEQGPEPASRGMVDPETMAFIQRATEAG